MESNPLPSRRRFSPARAASIDKACDRFEAAWKSESAPRIEDHLANYEDQSVAELFEQLLSIELAYRERRGEAPGPTEYQQRFPSYAEQIAAAFAAHGEAASENDDLTHDEIRTSKTKTTSGPFPLIGLHIRCPHCRNPVEIAVDASFADITCSSCGSHISLIDLGGETKSAKQLTTIGHFDLVECLGVGGFGTVWKARDTQLDRTVAVKIPRKGQLGPQELEKFFREARTAAQLKHPNIVSVHEVGRDEETVYIVSDLVRGVSLSNWLSIKHATAREAADFCVKLADALAHAHEQGVVHRDLKPQNILIDAEGQPHLTDFGLAKRETGEITMTLDGQVLGTPAYMSPEQARGEGHAADARADVYSLGVILFRLLTGELPFRGNADMILHQVINDEPQSPRRLNRTIPRDLETITLKCLEKEPGRRYQTARDLQDDLRRFLRHEPIKARRIGSITKAWRWRRRNPAVAGLLATTAVVLLLATLVSSYFAVKLAISEAKRTASLVDAMIGRSEALRQSRTEGYRQDLWEIIRQTQTLDTSVAKLDKLRHEAVSAMGDFVGLAPIDHQDCSDDVTAIALHPSAQRLAIGLKNGNVLIVNPESGESLHTLSTMRHPVRAIRFLADGSRLVCVSCPIAHNDEEAQAIAVVFAQASASSAWGETSRLGLGKRFESACFSPEGDYLLTRTSHWINLWDLQRQELVVACDDEELLAGQEPMPGGAIRSASYCLQQRLLAIGYTYENEDSDERGIIIWNTEERTVVKKLRIDLGSAYPNSMAFSADGKLFAFGCDRALVLYDVPSFDQRSMRRTGTIKAVTFSNDQQFFASIDMRGRTDVWSVSTGNQVAALTNPIRGTADEWLVYADGNDYLAASNRENVRVWRLNRAVERKVIAAHSDGIPTVAFSPTDDLLITGSKDQSVSVWDSNTCVRLFELSIGGSVQSVNLSPDGTRLAVAHWGGLNASVEIWDLETRALVVRAQHQLGKVNRIVFIGQHLAAAASDGIAIWALPDNEAAQTTVIDPSLVELRRGKQVRTVCLDVAASADGRFIAWAEWSESTGEYTVRLWDWKRDSKSRPLAKRAPPMFQGWKGLAFLPDAQQLVFVAKSGNAEIWDVEKKERVTVVGDERSFGAPEIAVSSDGRWLALKTNPGTVSVWDTTTRDEIFPFRSERSTIYAMAWNPDGTKLALGLNDGGLVIWDVKAVGDQLRSLGLGLR